MFVLCAVISRWIQKKILQDPLDSPLIIMLLCYCLELTLKKDNFLFSIFTQVSCVCIFIFQFTIGMWKEWQKAYTQNWFQVFGLRLRSCYWHTQFTEWWSVKQYNMWLLLVVVIQWQSAFPPMVGNSGR